MKKKILIIDDEERLRFIFQALLTAEGYEVVTAEDFSSALTIISSTELDLIFADIVLERGGTGIDILREVKSRGLHCPVVLITGYPDLETAAEAVRLGAFDYLPKPITRETLIRIARQAIHYKTLIDEKHRVEAEKEHYRSTLEAVFQSVNDGIITVDQDLRIININKAAERLCGPVSEEIIGKKFSESLAPWALAGREVLKKTLEIGEPIREYRVECHHPEQLEQVVVLTTSSLRDEESAFRGVVLVIRDITRLTDLERKLKERYQLHRMIGNSKKMQAVYNLVEDLADQDTTVLITGESGTGKELLADALHYTGSRGFKPLVKVNCSVLAENLLESELFGHVKGAFTGALKDKVGRFRKADGGTIFLDEIGDISHRVQLKLLRVLEEKEFEPVGDSTPIKVNIRVIASTNCNLKEKVRQGELREDIYYRLKVVEITLPPLRERREDIPLFIDHFGSMFNQKFNKQIEGLSDEVLKVFLHYPWPGNIRELEHALEHAYLLCHSQIITLDDLPLELREYTQFKGPTLVKDLPGSSEDILQVLTKTDGNKAKAARLLGISRQTLYRKIR
ncbi:MAG: sigma 54-interacting transcriptional regulator, partial [Pseudomonadota bacterium]